MGGLEEFTLETHDGKTFQMPLSICEMSDFLKTCNENLDDEDGVVKLGQETGIDGETMAFIFKHPGVNVQTVMPDLKKNLDAKDYEHVKGLEGIDKIPQTAKYIKALNVLDIKPLRQVY